MDIQHLSALSNQLNSDDERLKELEHALLKLTTIIENSRDVLYSFCFDTISFEYISPSIFNLTGYSINELLQMSKEEVLKIVHPDDREKFKNYWMSVKNRRVKHNLTFEYRIKPRKGITRWISDNHQLLYDDHDKATKLIGNMRDITDIKLVEDALQRSRDRLSMAMEATNDGMWDWKLDTNEVYFDVRFYTMLGYEPFEFPGAFHEWMKRIHPDDLNHVQNQLNKHLDGKSDQWLIEYRFLSKNGHWIWVLNRGKVFERDDDGKAMRMVGTHSDLTLRKKAELTLKQKNEDLQLAENKLKAANHKLVSLNDELQIRNHELQTIYDQLQISEEKFRQLAENTLDVFWLRDLDHILYINPMFEKVWGRSREEVYRNPMILAAWVHPEDKHLYNSWVDFDQFPEGQPHVEKYRILRNDGEIRWIWARMIPVYKENKIYRLVGIATDITDQQKTEEVLIATREKALESDRLKSAFLANISHEIRTPMNGIIGFSELLKGEHISQECQTQYINIISKSSEQLLRIMNDIIDISKIESNQVQLTPADVSLKFLFSELDFFFQNEKSTIGKNEIQLVQEIQNQGKDTWIWTDESRLRQILFNLISNALKFTHQGFIRYGFYIPNDHEIEFFVKDTGIGIPLDMQTIIFNRFYQLDTNLTRNFGGTGLGLSICEGLINLMGGKIWLKSEKNIGSEFYFTLPLKLASEPAPQPYPKKHVEDFDWNEFTILAVENDEINLEFLEAILASTNVTLIKTSTAEEAVDLCGYHPEINLVLMDIRLPQMNGYEALGKIRKLRPFLPVIAHTAFTLTEDSKHGLDFGFDDYVPKPVHRINLLSMIHKHLHK